MKKFLFLIAVSFLALGCHAQSLDITNINNKKCLLINMKSEQPGFEKVEIVLKEESVTHFVKSLRTWKKKINKMIPSMNGKSGMIKPVPGNTASFDYLFFRHNNGRSYSTQNFLVPELYIEESGAMFLKVRGYYRGDEVSEDGSKKERCEFNYSALIPVEDLGSYISRIENKLLDIRYNPSRM